jgi:hypothetical protein
MDLTMLAVTAECILERERDSWKQEGGGNDERDIKGTAFATLMY